MAERELPGEITHNIWLQQSATLVTPLAGQASRRAAFGGRGCC